jgi:photosystem II cytochrome c550
MTRVLPRFLHRLAVLVLASLFSLWVGLSNSQPVRAESIAPFVRRFLDAREPVSFAFDHQGQTKTFSGVDLSEGKFLFENNCKNCHVGGATLPDPSVPLSLTALRGATPPRDTIQGLVAYIRQPRSYDGTEEAYLCRQVSENWMTQDEVEKLSAFILRSAEKAPGWGATSF